jgi:tetratricopeptide (TPR) repeat protein
MKKEFLVIFLLNFCFIDVFSQSDYNSIYDKAIENINIENYNEGIRLLQSIEDRGDFMLFYNLGYCHYFLENDELAQFYFGKSIELKNDFVKSHGYLGMSYFFTNQLNNSEKEFLQCIDLDGTNYNDYFFLGKIYENRNNIETAINYYLKSLEYNSTDFNTNYALANIYFDDGDYENADRYFEECDKINNQLYPVVNCLIRIKYKQNNLERVEELKGRLRKIKQNTDNENLNKLSRFTIDTFTYENFHIFVEESFDLSGDLYYHWVFRICDNNDNFIRSVNLESSLVLRELGTNYIVGIDRYESDRRIHQTTGIGFNELPDYSVMKKIVIEEMEKGLDVGVTGMYPHED